MSTRTKPARVRQRAPAEPHPRQLRELLIVLAHELFPDAREAAIVIDNGLGSKGWSGVRVERVPRRHRWPGRPRAFQSRRRLGKLVAEIFGDCVKAGACFYRGELIGCVKIPLPGRSAGCVREAMAREGGAA